ncbi:MAG: hypothetical protein ACK5N7_08680, partial [Curvibacter sp.]
ALAHARMGARTSQNRSGGSPCGDSVNPTSMQLLLPSARGFLHSLVRAFYQRHFESHKGGMVLGFRATVVAGVLSTLIAAFVTWLLGFGPAAWAWFSATVATIASAVWSVVAYVVPVPLGVLALLGLVLTYYFARKLPKVSVSKTETSTVQTLQKATTLSENELKVVRLLAAADGQWAKLDEIAAAILLSRLLTEQALEKLFEKGFLLDRHNYLHGTSFRLSSEGRNYAIEQGLV